MDNENLLDYLKDAIRMESQLYSLNRAQSEYESQIKKLNLEKNFWLEEKEYFNGTRDKDSSKSKYCYMITPVKIGSEIVDTIRRVYYSGGYRKTSFEIPTDGRFPIDEKRYDSWECFIDKDKKEKSIKLFERELPHSLWYTEEIKDLIKRNAEYFRDNIYELDEKKKEYVRKKAGFSKMIDKIISIFVPIAIFVGGYGMAYILGVSGVKAPLLAIILMGAPYILSPLSFILLPGKYNDFVMRKVYNTTEYGNMVDAIGDNIQTWLNEYEKPLLNRIKELYENDITQKKEWYQDRIDLIMIEYSKILNLIDETKTALDRIYAKDFIHPKYQNFIAVAQFYDYLTTGRCDELTGAHGAYSLFESELGQNIILLQLDTIKRQLGELNVTMYTVCNEVQRTNTLLSGISSYLDQISTSMTMVANNTSLLAYNTQCTSYNADIMNRY